MYADLAQSVEHSAVNRVVVGSSPTFSVELKILNDFVVSGTYSSANDFGELAQLGERLPCTQKVKGSTPLFSIMRCREVAISPAS